MFQSTTAHSYEQIVHQSFCQTKMILIKIDADHFEILHRIIYLFIIAINISLSSIQSSISSYLIIIVNDSFCIKRFKQRYHICIIKQWKKPKEQIIIILYIEKNDTQTNSDNDEKDPTAFCLHDNLHWICHQLDQTIESISLHVLFSSM